ncbi:MAG TPA: transglutaminase family protein [Candidatus Binatia bacterium]|jgi:transglutaminase-like putative cysteine protease
MRLAIRYVTRFLYEGPVWQSHNTLRACPMDADNQRVIEYRVTTTPPSRVYSYLDYWGTRVDAFGVRPPHPRLEIVAEAVVETRAPSVPAWAVDLAGASDAAGGALRCTRTALARPEFVSSHVEYLEVSPHTRWDGELRAQAEAWIAPAGDDAAAAVGALYRAVGATMTYAPGATTVGVDVNAVLRQRVGVCQDFAHLLIALCRSVGIPARYVSGYLLSQDGSRGDAPPGGVVEVKTHAWAEVALADGLWVPLDPTNQRPVSERHVKIGHGRDYDDVLPLRGVYLGAAEHQLDVVVRMRELAAQPGMQQ